jgi:hypothetical protein
MNKFFTIGILISGILSLSALLIMLLVFDKLYTQILWFICINSLYILIATKHATKATTSRTFGAYLVVYMLIYIWISYDLYSFWIFRDSMNLSDFFYLNPKNYYFNRYALRTILISVLCIYGVYHLLKGEDIRQTIKTWQFRFIMVLLGSYLIGEMPIYDVSGDIGGNLHGHSFWYGFHMH